MGGEGGVYKDNPFPEIPQPYTMYDVTRRGCQRFAIILTNHNPCARPKNIY